ncbi:MAG: hypothetical protein IJX83_07640 [Lachnospiraceae bacterium]|nr:hypothetical protein [Lachnospiraceae bacterium]
MKHYLIDSENVGDFWIPLLELPADQAELIVFYTKNSPHMSYDSLIKLKESDRTVTFIKCYEGTNALDFQLCSELGFLIAVNPGDEFIIVTNDTGYDAAVKYWRRKEYSVKRIAGKDSRTGSRRRGTTAKSDVASEVSAILHKLVRMPDHEESDVREEQPEEEGMETVSEDQMIPEADSEEEYEEEPVDGDPEDSEEEIDPKEDYEEEDPDLIFEESPEDPSEEFSEEELSEEEFSEDVKEECTGEEAAEETREDSEAETAAGSEPAQVQDTESADLNEEEIEEDAEGADVSSTEEEPQGFVPDPDEITAIVSCIGMENLAELHNQLIQFYGDDGKDVYLSLKSGTLSIDKKDWDKEEKFLYYCALIFRHSDVPAEELSEENISEFAQFLLGAENKRKNLNSLRYALLKHYGKEKGRRYYFMLKPYVKALNQM